MRTITILSIAILLSCRREVPPASISASATPAVASRCMPNETTLCPIDEGDRDASFASYRRQLRAAVKRRDANALLELVDPAIRTSFGAGGGRDAFRKLLSDQESGARVWQEISDAIALGGTFRGVGPERMFWAPYVYSAWPEKLDAFTHMAVVRNDAPLRRSPAANAPVMRMLDWAIVELIAAGSKDPAWRHVRTADGASGWIRAADLRSPIAYRAGFRQAKGAWKMSAFVSGD